jgi:hypothetical protein
MPPSFYYRKADDKSLCGEPYPPLPAIITGVAANTESAQDEMDEFKATTRGEGKET